MNMKRRILYTLAILFISLQTFAQSKVKYEYDANNRLTQVTYSNGVTVSYTYDALGNRLTKKVTGAAPIKKGDVNGDGEITAQDASLVLQLVAKKIASTDDGIAYEAADVNDDGDVTAQDASLILQYVAKKITW